jgi:membrane complex biogenesis BtpA family protein
MNKFVKLFGRKYLVVIGMIHVRSLPGSPKSFYSMQDIISTACQEAHIYKNAALDAIMLENMHDLPWMRRQVLAPETVAAMAVVAAAVRRELPTMPLGIQILSSANKEALAVAKAADLNFIRAEGWVYAHIGDEGYTESCAAEITRYRKNIDAEDILIFTDIKKKHSSHMLTSDISIAETAQAAELFLSDGVIITGSTTGVAPDLQHFLDVQSSVKCPTLIGSGVTRDNCSTFAQANALILGSHLKIDGFWENDIDSNSVEEFMKKVDSLRKLSTSDH